MMYLGGINSIGFIRVRRESDKPTPKYTPKKKHHKNNNKKGGNKK